ncbi:glycerophosphodiester phosphodiesterase family protein [Ammoniphilus sp. CFH 90114]|uniref:glycerophosphodiester phosphodiesterase family protein n=1 Tax=Ammoniphilus sp. CFH 90114 TaxID=2493665 RepID=UPI0013E99006|nr:glycerophosphodiester phosphodiesterase family protein [Ammoniphilus sp. CFH 90114]
MRKWKKLMAAVLTCSMVLTTVLHPVLPTEAAAESNSELLITEIVPDNTGTDEFEFFEVYNNTNGPLNLSDYTFLYRYTTGTTADLTFQFPATTIQPQSALVFWYNSYNRTSQDFNAHFGTNASPDQLINVTGFQGFANTGNRAVVIQNKQGEEVAFASYVQADVKAGFGVHYRYSATGTVMEKHQTQAQPTPGTVEAAQVPAAPITLPGSSERKSLTANKTLVAPVLDGRLEESIWKVEESIGVKFGEGAPEDSHFGMLWDQKYLYIAVETEDNQLVHNGTGHWFDQDNFSLFFDPSHHKSAPFIHNDMQIGLVYQPNSSTPSFHFGGAPNHASKDEKKVLRAIQKTDTGWSAEVAIPWDMLQFDPQLKRQLGFEITVTDRDDLEGQAPFSAWSAYQSNSFWNDTAGYGTIHLADETVTGDVYGVLLEENFDSYQTGETPYGWISDVNGSSPAFTVVQETYGGGRLVFDGSSSSKQSRITAPVQWDNYTIEADMRFDKVLNSARWASIMFRVPSNGKHPYNQMAVRQNGAFEFAYRNPSNTWVVPTSGTWQPLALGSDYTLKVRVFDQNVKEYIKAKKDEEFTLLMDQDFNATNLLERGKVGFQGDQLKVSFDNLKVTRITAERLNLELPATVEALTGPMTVTNHVYFSDGIEQEVPVERVKLYSSDESIVKVTNNQLYPLKQGQVTIKAIYDTAEAEAELTVTPSTVGAAVVSLEHEAGYVLGNAGVEMDLSSLSFNASFSDFTTGTIGGEQLTWSSLDPAVSMENGKLKTTQRGIYELNAKKDDATVKLMLIVKEPGDSEYVLYEENFDALEAGTMPQGWSRIEGTGTGAVGVKEGAFEMEARTTGNNPTRVILPEYLDSFGNYKIEADVTNLGSNDAARWHAIMFRIQNNNYPYYQMAVRQNAAATNGVEFAERTPTNQWNVSEKGAFTEAINAEKMYKYTIKAHGNRVQEFINDSLLINTDLAGAYTKGRIGFQANGSKMKVDNIRVTLLEEPLPALPGDRFVKVTEPATKISLAPTVVAQVETMEELASLNASTLPATVILPVNQELKVSNSTGTQEIGSLNSVLQVIDNRMIPAFYVKDEQTVNSLVSYLKNEGIEDAFVISSNASLVKQARIAYPMIRGIIEFDVQGPLTHEELMDIRRTTNSSLAKVALLSQGAASKENVAYLQERLVTVWAKEEAARGAETLPLHRLITAGVNGIVTDSPGQAIQAFDVYNQNTTLVRKPLNIGHRGIPALAPENTLEGAILAYEKGADVVENDIYLTKDGHIVVMHDTTLDRTTTGTGKVEDYTLAELQAFKANKQFPTQYPDAGIPTLEQFFDEFKGKDLLHFVEIKSYKPEIIDALVQLIEEKGVEDQVVVITFNADQIKRLGEKMPGMSAGLLTSGYANENNVEKSMRETLKVIQPINATFNTSYSGLGKKFMEASKHRGMTIWPWTYRNQKDFINYFAMGTYGLTTDYNHWAMDWAANLNPVQEKVELVKGESVELKAQAETYGRVTNEVTPEIVLLDGQGLVEIEGNKVMAKGKGTVHALLRYTASMNATQTYDLYTQPVTIEIKDQAALEMNGPKRVKQGREMTLNLEIGNDIQDLYGASLKLTFDPTQLQVKDADPTTDGVQIQPETWLSGAQFVNEVDNTAGIITFAVTQLGETPGVSGNGRLAQVQFQVNPNAAGTIEVVPVTASIKFANSQNRPIHVDLATYQAQVSQSLVHGAVKLSNKHHLADLSGFRVQLKQEGQVVDEMITQPDGKFVLAYEEVGTYTVEVAAPHYLSTSQIVRIEQLDQVVNLEPMTSYVGDFDQNGKIDIADIAMLAKAFEKEPVGNDQRYDVDKDGDIDIHDVVTVAVNFGRP